jgi:hypothetical protein
MRLSIVRPSNLEYLDTKKPTSTDAGFFAKYGAPETIRTSDRSVRSRVLYPAELRARFAVGDSIKDHRL